MAYCEDYPCCGHTPDDPCERQWYDEPGAFDTSRPGNEHALCDHEAGFCEVADWDEEDEEDEDVEEVDPDEPSFYVVAAEAHAENEQRNFI